MKTLKLLALALSLTIASLQPSSVWSQEVVQEQEAATITWSEVVDYARENLLLEGELIVKSDGFGYIKVDDEYIHSLLPMLGLAAEGFREPPYFRSPDSPGAHISVFYVDEHIIPDEVGQTFHFELKEIVIVQSSYTTSYVVLQVASPELEKLREKYGLEAKLHGHEYHISIGKKQVLYPPK